MLGKGIVLRRLVMAQPREAANSAAKERQSSTRRRKGEAECCSIKHSKGIVLQYKAQQRHSSAK